MVNTNSPLLDLLNEQSAAPGNLNAALKDFKSNWMILCESTVRLMLK